MMRADYDSRGDTIQIELERVDRIDYGDYETGAVVGILEGRPVYVDVISARRGGVEEPLRAAAERYGLDAEALIAAALAALAAPDRPVTLDVGVRAAA
ncbi:MAG TPA: hypothetical protein VF770_05245 [Solirubrobacterales bacterium]